MQNEYVSGDAERIGAFFKGVIDSWSSCVAKVTAEYLESLSPECEKQVAQAIAYMRAKDESENDAFEKRLSSLEQRMERLIDLLEKWEQS